MVHIILVKASYQITLSVLIASLMSISKFLGDFNANANEKRMEKLCKLNGLTSLIKKPTCFKNSDKPICIDLTLTNQPNYFQQLCFRNRTFRLLLNCHRKKLDSKLSGL